MENTIFHKFIGMRLTLPTRTRKKVVHDLKKRFPRGSHDEFQACRNKACWIYESWKNLDEQTRAEQGYPTITHQVPRPQTPNRNRFILTTSSSNTLARYWVGIRDSLDTKRKGKRKHERLWIPWATEDKKFGESCISVNNKLAEHLLGLYTQFS